MGTAELILIAVALSMDAFAASVCKGLSMKQIRRKDALIIAVFFGGFQALMPLAGWYAGLRFE
ncbi:MAG: manganese efflux pump, partial [Eubacteriales bacterium]|nr:manganese efflux pump [Eubacteriales bacterium]